MWLAAAIVFFLAICIVWNAAGAQAPPLPPLVSSTNVYFYGATAWDSEGNVSDYSNEAILITTGTQRVYQVRLAWDPSPVVTNYDILGEPFVLPVTNYQVLAGYWSRTYSYHTNAGTNLTVVIPAPFPPHPMDQIVRVWATNSPSITLTNPQGRLYIRAHAWKSWGKWPTELQCASGPDGPWIVLVGPVTNSAEPDLSLNVSRVAYPREE